MSRIAVAGVGAQTASTNSPQTVAVPKGTQAGDLMVMVIGAMPGGTAGTNDAVTLTGWTQLGATSRREIGTIDCSVQIWTKVAAAAETDPSLGVGTALAGGGVTQGFSGQIVTLRGQNATISDATAVTSNGAAAATFTPTGITTVTNGAVVLSAVCTADDNALAFSASQSFSLLMGGIDYDTTQGSDHAVGLACKEIDAAGAVTCPTWSEAANGNDAWAAITVAFRPDTTTWALEETWMEPDAADWPAATGWVAQFESSGTSVECGAASGRIITGAVGGGADIGYNFILGPENADIRVDHTYDVAAHQINEIRFRYNNVEGDWYTVKIGRDASAVQFLTLIRNLDAVETTYYYVDSTTTFTLAAGDVTHLHIRTVGQTLKLRHWKNTAAEPSIWQYDDPFGAMIPPMGYISLVLTGGTAAASVAARWRALQVAAVTIVDPPPKFQGLPPALLAR